MRDTVRDLIPPAIFKLYQRLFNRYGFSGNYATWEDAKKVSSGYDSALILDKVKEALLKVKKGEAVYERDSVIFDKVEYSWPLLASLIWIAANEGGRLNIIDFGGSLGSTYFQNRKFLVDFDVKWNIVDQKHFVECGKKYFADDRLNFYYDLESCLKEQKPSAIVFSSVLQYLEKPYEFMGNVLKHRFRYILIDRTTFVLKGDDRITVQKIPPEIYRASYPCWFFNLSAFIDFFCRDYELMEEFDALAGTIDLGDTTAYDKGFVFRRKAIHSPNLVQKSKDVKE